MSLKSPRMISKMINITLKIEGLREKKGIPFQIKTGTTIIQAIQQMAESQSVDANLVRDCFYNKSTGAVGVYMVLVNGKMVHHPKFDSHELLEGDEVVIIMPIAGG